jgi:hypothetical protein
MNSIQETMPPAPDAYVPAADPRDYIRLDRTRVTYVRSADGSVAISPTGQVLKTESFSTIHSSERTPDDPWFSVVYVQDGLPFDSEGYLVPDDGRTQPFNGAGPDGKPMAFRPLYSREMRATVDKKMRRILASLRSRTPIEDDGEDLNTHEVASDVSIMDWLMGDADYPFHQIQPAVKRRWGASLPNIAEVVRFLVLEMNVIPKEQVADYYKRYLLAPNAG